MTSKVLALSLLFALALPTPVQANDFLDPNQAFKVAAQGQAPGEIEISFQIEPGHYMYREKFAVSNDGGAALSLHGLPAGERMFDEAFQREMEIYRGALRIKVPAHSLVTRLQISGQGCADKGLCYPPMTSTLVAQGGGRWMLQPSQDPAGEFGAASLAEPLPPRVRWGLWAGLCGALFGLLVLSRKQ